MEVLLDVVSDERDPIKYPHPNDYSITLNRKLYNVTNITLVAAKIPLSQTMINECNNTFPVNNTYHSLPNRDFSSGDELASVLETSLAPQVSNVYYDNTTETLVFSNSAGNLLYFDFYNGENGYATKSQCGTPASVLGFNHSNVTNNSNVIRSGPIDLDGTTSIVLRLSTNGRDITRDVYNSGPSNVSIGNLDATESVYFGRLFTKRRGDYLEFTDQYPVRSLFTKGAEQSISSLDLKFYYTVGTKLVPYDFRNKNHTLKFKITCGLDKLNLLKDTVVIPKVLPPIVNLPKLELLKRTNKNKLITILFICLLCGLFILLLSKR